MVNKLAEFRRWGVAIAPILLLLTAAGMARAQTPELDEEACALASPSLLRAYEHLSSVPAEQPPFINSLITQLALCGQLAEALSLCERASDPSRCALLLSEYTVPSPLPRSYQAALKQGGPGAERLRSRIVAQSLRNSDLNTASQYKEKIDDPLERALTEYLFAKHRNRSLGPSRRAVWSQIKQIDDNSDAGSAISRFFSLAEASDDPEQRLSTAIRAIPNPHIRKTAQVQYALWLIDQGSTEAAEQYLAQIHDSSRKTIVLAALGKAYAASRQTEQAIAAASAIFSLNDDTFYDDSGYKAYSLAAIALALQAAGAEHEAKEVAITLVWTRKHGNEHRAIYGIARLAGAAKRAEHSNFFLQLLSADRAFAEASTEVLECRSDPKYLRLLLPMLREVGGSHYQEEYFRFLASYRALTVGLSPALWLDGIETPHMADGLKLLQMLSRTSDALETRRSIQTYLDSFRTREKYELLQLLRVFGRMITALKAHASSAELLAWTKNRNNLHHITLLKLGETAVRERQAPVALFKDQELPMNFHKELAVSLAALAARTGAAELVKQIREALISSSPIDQAAFEFSVADRLLDTSASDDFCDYFELHSLTP